MRPRNKPLSRKPQTRTPPISHIRELQGHCASTAEIHSPRSLDVSSRDPLSDNYPSSPSSATVRARRSSAVRPPSSPSMSRRRFSERTVHHHGPSRVEFLTAAPSAITADDSVRESAAVRRRNLTVRLREVRRSSRDLSAL
ncbi:large envelope protein [Striga asiatica]|uniref:Large envelope protein n=1 Tax=Striga asiatica TaxID=4170 RepID=A0A5A7QJG6_STRAF|nr:large envelope protein [Striga asiatica]